MGESAFAHLTRRVSAEDAQTLRAGTLILDVRLKAEERHALEALRWAMSALRALVSLTGGAVVDPAAQTAWGVNAAHLDGHWPSDEPSVRA